MTTKYRRILSGVGIVIGIAAAILELAQLIAETERENILIASAAPLTPLNNDEE